MPYDKIFLAVFFRTIYAVKKYFKKMILITLPNACSISRQIGCIFTTGRVYDQNYYNIILRI